LLRDNYKLNKKHYKYFRLMFSSIRYKFIDLTIPLETVFFLYDDQYEIGAVDEEGNFLELRILGTTSHAEIGAAVGVELYGKILCLFTIYMETWAA
jgi:hypothetical protein